MMINVVKLHKLLIILYRLFHCFFFYTFCISFYCSMDNHANPYSLYIPRVSLSSSSSSSSTKSHRLNQFLRTHQVRSEISESSGESGSENRDKVGTETQMHTKNRTYSAKPYSSNYSYVHSEKRGSRSSQSSSSDDSNHVMFIILFITLTFLN